MLIKTNQNSPKLNESEPFINLKMLMQKKNME